MKLKFLTFAFLKNGEVSEWPNVQAWKVCVPQGTAGSNPAFSADKSNKVPQFCGTFLFSGKSESFFAFKGFQENQKYRRGLFDFDNGSAGIMK